MLTEHLAAVLQLDPSAGAVEFQGAWWSWARLDAVARALDAEIARLGLGEGAPIGLVLRNDPVLIGAILGVLLGRNCIVTLSPHQGPERLAQDVDELSLPVIAGLPLDMARPEIAQAAARAGSLCLALDFARTSASRAEGGEVRRVAAPGSGAGAGAGATPVRHPSMSGVAVEMLTSGTTGRPKRVSLTLAALESSFLGARHYEGAQATKTPKLRSGVAIISGPLVHVGGLWRVLQCLADGRAFALLERFDVEAWRDLVVRHKPATASLVPAALRMVLDAKLDREDLASLRSVVSGTAPLPPEHAEQFESQYGIPVLTTYGATEFAGGVAGWNLKDYEAFGRAKRGSVGRAHPGCELRVVDAETGSVLGADAEGLLEVRSAQLGQHSGWVRTTDRAVIDSDGFLFIRGRADSAIIRGGFKVHPGAVESALERHGRIREACVVGLPDARLGQIPVAAVLLDAPVDPPSEQALKDHCKRLLASYEVPARVLIVDALPRTPSMKVCRPDVEKLFETVGPEHV